MVKNGFSSNIVVSYIVRKLYKEAITTFVKKNEIFIFGPKLAQISPKEVKNVFLSNIVVSYIFRKLMTRSILLQKIIENFHYWAQKGPKWLKKGPLYQTFDLAWSVFSVLQSLKIVNYNYHSKLSISTCDFNYWSWDKCDSTLQFSTSVELYAGNVSPCVRVSVL